jgi:hypothetical protein
VDDFGARADLDMSHSLWLIIRRTGRQPALALIGVLPLAALALLWRLAFADWPIERKSHPQAQSNRFARKARAALGCSQARDPSRITDTATGFWVERARP